MKKEILFWKNFENSNASTIIAIIHEINRQI